LINVLESIWVKKILKWYLKSPEKVGHFNQILKTQTKKQVIFQYMANKINDSPKVNDICLQAAMILIAKGKQEGKVYIIESITLNCGTKKNFEKMESELAILENLDIAI
jgi:hypothetical protein